MACTRTRSVIELYSLSEKFDVVASQPVSRSCRNWLSTLFFRGIGKERTLGDGATARRWSVAVESSPEVAAPARATAARLGAKQSCTTADIGGQVQHNTSEGSQLAHVL